MISTLRISSRVLRGVGEKSLVRPSFSTSSLVSNKESSNKEYPPNNSINPTFINNQNPRNLEKLRLAEKVIGWDLEKPGRSFWNKLAVEMSGKHISAQIVHVEGQTPVSASTKEWCIKKYLFSTKDAIAAKTVGEVLARRCLQTGITEVACFFSDEDRKKDKVSTLLKAFQDGGVALEEQSQIEMPWSLNYPVLPEKSWDIHEEIEDKLEQAATILPLIQKVKSKSSRS